MVMEDKILQVLMINDIQKLGTIALMALTLTMTTSANAGWFDSFDSNDKKEEIQPDYVWDDSKSYYMNSVLKAGIDDEDYKTEFTKQAFVDTYGPDLLDKEYVEKSKSALKGTWFLLTGGFSGLQAYSGNASRAFDFDNKDHYSFAFYPKTEYATKDELMVYLDGYAERRQITEHETYFVNKRKLGTVSQAYHINLLKKDFYDVNFSTFVVPERSTRYVKQPHLIEGGKIYLPLKVN